MFKLTEQVVKAVAENWDSGKDVMALLLDRGECRGRLTQYMAS